MRRNKKNLYLLGGIAAIVAAVLLYFLLKPESLYAKYEVFNSEDKQAGELKEETIEKNDVTWVLRYPQFEEEALQNKVEAIKKEALQLEGKEGDVISLDYRSKETYSHYISVELRMKQIRDGETQHEKTHLFTYDKDTKTILQVKDVLRGQYHDMLKQIDQDADVAKTDEQIWIEEDSMYIGSKQTKLPYEKTKAYLYLKDKNIETLAPQNNILIDPMEVDPNKPMIAFTFDDGPHYENTEKLISLFQSYGGRATFFMVGNKVEGNPDVVQAVHDAGFEIGNHSYSHENLALSSVTQRNEEIFKTQDIIFSLTGQEPTLLRPPYGEYNEEVERQSDMTIALWSVDTEDWKSRDAQAIKNNILTYAYDGAVILLHDIYESSYEGVKAALPQLAQEGYQFVDMGTLLKYR